VIEVRADNYELSAERGIATREQGDDVLRRERGRRDVMPNQWMRDEVLLEVSVQWREAERAKSARDVRGRGIIAWRTGATAGESFASHAVPAF
jgi:hypothetical protein